MNRFQLLNWNPYRQCEGGIDTCIGYFVSDSGFRFSFVTVNVNLTGFSQEAPETAEWVSGASGAPAASPAGSARWRDGGRSWSTRAEGAKRALPSWRPSGAAARRTATTTTGRTAVTGILVLPVPGQRSRAHRTRIVAVSYTEPRRPLPCSFLRLTQHENMRPVCILSCPVRRSLVFGWSWFWVLTC